MKQLIIKSTLFVFSLILLFSSCKQTNGATSEISNSEIMEQLSLSANGKSDVVKNFPDSFPGVLTSRGEPIVYTRKNSNNFEYIGMPVGGIGAGQLYLGGDGQLWFWDIFNLNYKRGQLKGQEAYEFPYTRSKPNEMGATAIEQGFSISVKKGDKWERKLLNRDGIDDIKFLGQYPIGEVTYNDPKLPVAVCLKAFSPFIPLDVDKSSLPATIMKFTVKNNSTEVVEAKLDGWLENAVLLKNRKSGNLKGKLVNNIEKLTGNGLRLECTAEIDNINKNKKNRPDILFENFENGYEKWTVTGNAFGNNGKPYNHNTPIEGIIGGSLADSFNNGPEAQGKLTSNSFKIERPFIRLNVGGGREFNKTAVNILVDDMIVASVSGFRSTKMKEEILDLRSFIGQDAIIEIVDSFTEEGGFILVDHIVFTDKGRRNNIIEKELVDNGSMALTLLDGYGNSISDFKGEKKQHLEKETSLVGSLGKVLKLNPGETTEVTFALTWYFPKTLVVREKPEQKNYAKRFKNASEVSDYVINNIENLEKSTLLWRDTWYESSLPYWFLDRTFLNTSILASGTSSIIRDNLFYGTEGGNQGYGNCTHVWGYVQAMGRLFPDLEKSLREQVDFKEESKGGALKEDGTIKFRWNSSGLAVDGQSGVILRAYLSHQMSGDKEFLKRIYPSMKKALQGLTTLKDADHDGILTGGQHNTLDSDWHGKITWLSLHYTVALRAMAKMANEMGDTEYASFCVETANKGRKYIENNLFNGEYFYHEADPEFPKSPGTYTGLEYSQLLGQSWAYQVGLGEVIDPIKAKKALESMWKYNFSTDVGPFREIQKGGRWYAMPGEGGLIACTWPRGGSEVLKNGLKNFADYNNESQNGYEYAASSLMMWHNMPNHSLAHIWYMHNNRYIGSKRNPWCEIEWGLHYSRSMASYGHFVGASGFEYHGPKGYMAFSPKITPNNFKSAFTSAEGWGTFIQTRKNNEQTNSIELKYGKLILKELAFDIPENNKLKSVELKHKGESVLIQYASNNNRVNIIFDKKIEIKVNEAIKVLLKY